MTDANQFDCDKFRDILASQIASYEPAKGKLFSVFHEHKTLVIEALRRGVPRREIYSALRESGVKVHINTFYKDLRAWLSVEGGNTVLRKRSISTDTTSPTTGSPRARLSRPAPLPNAGALKQRGATVPLSQLAASKVSEKLNERK